MARRRSAEDRKLDALIAKINKTKQPSHREERGLTARIKTHDMTPDPYLVGITAKSEGKDPVAAISKSKRKLTMAERVAKSIKATRDRERAHADKVEASKAAPIRREVPMPQQLTAIMAPPLPDRSPGTKPNIVALIYAFRAFQQYSHAFTRRRLGDPYSREVYYKEMKARFIKAMEDAGLADLYDWEEIE